MMLVMYYKTCSHLGQKMTRTTSLDADGELSCSRNLTFLPPWDLPGVLDLLETALEDAGEIYFKVVASS